MIIKEELEEVFIINEDMENFLIELQQIKPLKIKTPVHDIASVDAKPKPSSSRAVLAEVVVCHNRPLAPPFVKQEDNPFELAPKARLSPPLVPANMVKRRKVPNGHASAKPRLKVCPYQARR